MNFISSLSEAFPYKECSLLYEKNKKYFLPLDISFDELIGLLKYHFWAVTLDGEFIGFIYFEQKEGKIFLSGCSHRKQLKGVTQAVKDLCRYYFEQFNLKEIYSDTPHKHAKIALLRAGFKQISKERYKINV